MDMGANMPAHPLFHQAGGMENVKDMVGLNAISLSVEKRRSCKPLEAHALSSVPRQILHVEEELHQHELHPHHLAAEA